MKKWLAPICACLVLGLAVGGCGDDEEDSDGGSAATTEQPATTAKSEKSGGAAATAEKSASVEAVDIDFEPKNVTIAKGGTITWTNTGNLPHTVTKEEGPGPDFDSGSLNSGDTFKQTFKTAGKIDYVCRIHAGQRGTVTVE
jgi:plastocyanin